MNEIVRRINYKLQNKYIWFQSITYTSNVANMYESESTYKLGLSAKRTSESSFIQCDSLKKFP